MKTSGAYTRNRAREYGGITLSQIQEHHKQMKMRYVAHFESLDIETRHYLRDLLKKHDVKVIKGLPEGYPGLNLTVEPRVVMVDKSIRLLLRHHWTCNSVLLPTTTAGIHSIRLCTHMAFERGQKTYEPGTIGERLKTALEDSEIPFRTGSCEECG